VEVDYSSEFRYRDPVVDDGTLVMAISQSGETLDTLAGIKAARARGRNGGRPRKLSSRDLKTVRTLVRSGEVPIATIAEQFGISRSTIYRNLGPAEAGGRQC
jgi:hypothetical protein